MESSQRLANLSPAKRQLLQQRLRREPQIAEPIAVVGMGCRFPGAADLDAYWRLIRDGVSAIGEIPRARWNIDELYDPTGQTPGKMSTRWGAFVDNFDTFDALFFGIAPREASKVDPQQRLLLEVAWEALEQGCLAPEKIAGTRCGVFIGIGGTDYAKVPTQYANYYEHVDAHGGTGNALSIAANRLSYLFDLRGPSLAVDTACSSALVGLHLAVQSLRNGECDAALAGGVNMILTPETTIAFSKARMLSPDGCCRPFDAGANGYVRGEGCGIVVLKRLTDAIEAGDNVLAVIRATAVNQDGRTSGITAPNGTSQQEVIRAALASGGITPQRISYVEAHGTGTPLGDPIEVQALAEVFRRRAADEPPVYFSSVKANVGHTETASGIAGLIKVILMMQHGEIPAQLHLASLNPHIQLDGSRLQLPQQVLPWESTGGPRTAGVSSFGFGGTNAHVVVEQAVAPPAPAPAAPVPERPQHVLALSAKSETALAQLAQRYAEFLDARPGVALPDFCFSASAGRSHFAHRLALVADRRETVREQLRAVAGGRVPRGVKRRQVALANRPKIAFLFTGQGSQFVGMGRVLYQTQPVFRRALETCDEILHAWLDESLLALLYPADGRTSPLDETVYTQPALFAFEYALAELWKSWGVEPSVVLGHSVGEYAAACVAGAFSLEDGLRLISDRGRLMQQLPRDGAMAVVFASAARVEPALVGLESDVALAALNGPENTVVSGRTEAVEELLARFEREGVKTQRLTVSHAFHSPLMDPMLDEFEQLAGEVTHARPRVPILSNLTGQPLAAGELGAGYWRRHVRNPVRFADSMQTLAALEPHALIEIGPSTTLLGMGRRCLPSYNAGWLPSLRKGMDDWQVLLDSLSELYTLGAPIDWAGFDKPWPRRRVALPTYPFERSRHWFNEDERSARVPPASRTPVVHPLLGARLPVPVETTIYESQLSSRLPKYLADHEVQGSAVVPAAAYLEIGLAAAEQVFGPGSHALENVSIQQAMFLPEGTARAVQVTLSPEAGGACDYATYSQPEQSESAKWTLHALGKLRHADAHKDAPPARVELAALAERLPERTDAEQFYDLMRARGLAYGPAFQVLDDLRRSDREALAAVALPASVAAELGDYHLHPALLDGLFQAMAGIVPREADGSASPYTYMPVQVRQVRRHGALPQRMWVYAVRTSGDDRPSPETVEGDVLLVDEQGQPILELCGVRVQRVAGQARGAESKDPSQWLYQLTWQRQELDAPSNGKAVAPGTWLLLADTEQLGDALAGELRTRGHQCVTVAPGAAFAQLSPAHYQLNPHSADDYRRLLAEVTMGDLPPLRGVLHAWSLSQPTDPEAASLAEAHRLGVGSVLPLVQQLARHGFSRPPALWLVTRGAQGADETAAVAAPLQTALWGLGRVAALELPELQCRMLDLDPAQAAAEQVGALVEELERPTAENQLALRAGNRLVARIERAAPAAAQGQAKRLSIPAGGRFRLRLAAAGSFDSLWFEPLPQRTPDAGQVEIEVRAAGLNFSDVLKAMGLYPGIRDEIVPLGIEAAGIVTAVGQGVTRFAVGDRVLGVVPYSFASHAITADYTLVKQPDSMTFAEASTVPITFLTAYHALVRLARLQPGERVLIHAGAGGVGLAAIQIAQQIGAEVFATAGSDEKRDYLRSLGVEHVFSSRTLDFAEEIREQTDRQGVDVVLNSLPGEAITKSIELLSAYGRFLEIGKIDIYQNRMIGLLPFQDNLSYFAIDLDRVLRQRPRYVQDLFAEVAAQFDAGHYRPLPLKEFTATETVDAFRYMAQRKNIGKVVVAMENNSAAAPANDAPQPIRGDGFYLITGGLGALGLQVARWLAGQGARHLALLARRAPSGEAADAIAELEALGVQVVPLRADISDEASLRGALDELARMGVPLRGVVHAAGVLEDGILLDMTPDRLARVLAPKIAGAWNLHRATSDAPLERFVLFSSVAALLGSPGQGNYAAGNAFLDGLAHYRRAQGLPALSINWGPWAGSGMAASGERSENVAARGMELLPADAALETLGRLLTGDAATVAVMDARWPALVRQLPGGTPPLLESVAPAQEKTSGERATESAFRAQLLQVGLDERKTILREYVTEELSRIIGIEPSQLDAGQPLNTLGLDSLMAMELKNKLETQLACTLPMAKFLEGPSVASLADFAAGLLSGEAEPSDASHEQPARSESWTPLIALQTAGARPPLFCVHPLGGDVRCYDGIAQAMAGERPVYAVRARGSEGDLPPHQSIDEMVRDYLAAIRAVQPSGPYHLCGWSTGGIYAYEMARQLEAAGEELGLLALFDSPLPTICENIDLHDDTRFLFDLVEFTNQFAGAAMRVSYEALRSQSYEASFEQAMAEAKRHGVVPADVPIAFLRRLVDVAKSNVRVLRDYQPAALRQPIHLFRPLQAGLLEEKLGPNIEADLGWGRVAGGPVELHEAPGHHFSMMLGENAQVLSELLAKAERGGRKAEGGEG